MGVDIRQVKIPGRNIGGYIQVWSEAVLVPGMKEYISRELQHKTQCTVLFQEIPKTDAVASRKPK